MKLLAITKDRGMPFARRLRCYSPTSVPEYDVRRHQTQVADAFSHAISREHASFRLSVEYFTSVSRRWTSILKRPDALEPKWSSHSETMLEAALA
jgi:hypothetical protein